MLYLADFSLVKSNNNISVSRLIEGIKVYLWYNNNNFTRLETVNYLHEVPVTCMLLKKKQLDLKGSQTFEVYFEYDTSFTPKKTHYNGATKPFDPQ